MIDYENGIASNDLPEFFNNQSQPVEQRQVIRTKTLGDTSDAPSKTDYKKIAERISREEAQAQKLEQRAEKANEIKAKILDKASEMRHLKYEVIEDADIVQISVINSTDGTVVRKVPPDKSVEFVRKIREKKSEKKNKLDIKV
ncbi:MAG: flagellar protein FlaG [Synergistaceae bacterium]|nr:flagellar protein FlaG [Synergistaceae bacterium]